MIVNFSQIILFFPLLVIGLTIIFIILSIIFCHRNKFTSFILMVFGISLAILSLPIVWKNNVRNFFQLIYIDKFSILCMFLILLSSLFSGLLAYRWLLKNLINHDEFYLLLLISSIGGVTLVSANNFIILFVGIELISFPLFGLIGYIYFHKFSLEASVKYVLLSGISSSFLLFGIALVYSETGFLSFLDVSAKLIDSKSYSVLLMTGLAMIIVSFGFKLSLVPFHLWTSDIYQGSLFPITLYLSTASKIAVIAALVRIISILPEQYNNTLNIILSGMSLCSILFGNLMAVKQIYIKRILAYSSIAHMGYLISGLLSLHTNSTSLETIQIYLISYFCSSIGIFSIVNLISSFCFSSSEEIKENRCESLHLYRGLFWYKPILAIAFTLITLSLAGFPMTFGFIGKFYLIILNLQHDKLYWLTFFIILGSIIGMIFYLKIIVNLYLFKPGNLLVLNKNIFYNMTNWASTLSGIIILISSICIVIFGFYPKIVLYFINLI